MNESVKAKIIEALNQWAYIYKLVGMSQRESPYWALIGYSRRDKKFWLESSQCGISFDLCLNNEEEEYMMNAIIDDHFDSLFEAEKAKFLKEKHPTIEYINLTKHL